MLALKDLLHLARATTDMYREESDDTLFPNRDVTLTLMTDNCSASPEGLQQH